MSHPDVGKTTHELDTPALLVDLDALDHNVATMSKACADAGIDWRPHIKASKSPDLAKRLLAGGAVGITCAKLSEAEVMADGGLTDILIANEIVGPTKIARLVRLATRARLCVAVDDETNVREIAAAAAAAGLTIDVLIDIDVNMHRCGVLPERAPALAELATERPGLRLRGLMGYEGHVMHLDPEEKERESAATAALLAEAQRLVEAAGFPVACQSGGGSGNYAVALGLRQLTEMQAGGAVLMDRTYESMGVRGHRRALFVLSQIISVPAADRAIGDAGWKSSGRHTGLPLVQDRADLECVDLNAEHTIYRRLSESPLTPGDRVLLVPSYSDSTILLHRRIHAVRDGVVEAVWPISAAGMLQ